MDRWVRTDWSCGCTDSYNYDRHDGGSYFCNREPGECTRKYAKEPSSIILFPLPPDPSDG